MEIHNVGYNFRHGKDFKINRPNGSGDMVIIMTKSRAVFTLKGEEIHVPSGAVTVYAKGTPQIFGADGEEFVNDWVHFDLSKGEAVTHELNIPTDYPFVLDDTAELSDIIRMMSGERYSESPYREQTLELYMRLLLYKLAEYLCRPKSEGMSPYYSRLSEIRAEIYNTPSRFKTVSEAAEAAHMSESYFQHLYKKYFGKSFMSDVIAGRMERARYLLTHTEYRVRDIAYELGYAAEEQFIRQFRATVGMTPTKYRRHNSISAAVVERAKSEPPYIFEKRDAAKK